MVKAKVSKKSKGYPWFVKVRGSYLPRTREGWLTYIPFIILALMPVRLAYFTYLECQDNANAACYSQPTRLIVGRFVLYMVIYYGSLIALMTSLAKRKS